MYDKHLLSQFTLVVTVCVSFVAHEQKTARGMYTAAFTLCVFNRVSDHSKLVVFPTNLAYNYYIS